MTNAADPIYNLAGNNIRICFSDPFISLILQAFYHYARTEEPASYTIHFQAVNPAELMSEHLLQKYLGARVAGAMMTLSLRVFKCFFLPQAKTIYSFYPTDIFSENEKADGFDLVYENTYNDQELPPHTHEVVYTVHWLLECLGIFRLHAAYVRYKNRNIILTGSGGVGKTTSSLNLYSDGGEIYCDDELFFQKNMETDAIDVFPVPRSMAVTKQTLDMFDQIIDKKMITKKRMHKFLLPLHSFNTNSAVQHTRPDIIVFPSLPKQGSSEKPRAQKISVYEGFTTFLNHEILFPPIEQHRKKHQLEIVETLAKQCQLYSFMAGPDLEQNLNLFKQVICMDPDGSLPPTKR